MWKNRNAYNSVILEVSMGDAVLGRDSSGLVCVGTVGRDSWGGTGFRLRLAKGVVVSPDAASAKLKINLNNKKVSKNKAVLCKEMIARW